MPRVVLIATLLLAQAATAPAQTRLVVTQVDAHGEAVAAASRLHCDARGCAGEVPIQLDQAPAIVQVQSAVLDATNELTRQARSLPSMVVTFGHLPGCERAPPGVPWRSTLRVWVTARGAGSMETGVNVYRPVRDASMDPPVTCRAAYVTFRIDVILPAEPLVP